MSLQLPEFVFEENGHSIEIAATSNVDLLRDGIHRFFIQQDRSWRRKQKKKPTEPEINPTQTSMFFRLDPSGDWILLLDAVSK